ncbi:hypothetical protein CPB84DRAFT_1681629 [Gymnopilus junonius]|uniref:AB hydrolase-1 domain-containing protein n=1 Tax=Gymnopilus junonius TaxID=109634 RepID=A0A9P5NL98_GYMJU|nr:hypothetical protein CPB84DRAFT_1681629 [Gymnopilus junonius]
MPSLTVRDNICFHYTDSGPPNKPNYSSLFIIHGHTFHSDTPRMTSVASNSLYLGAFRKITPLAASNGLRIICVNRREYPGSSPFTPEELRVFNEGCDAERAKLLNEQGILLCELVDSLINTLSLPKEGGITISSWSMGCIFAIAMLTAISDLPKGVRERLRGHVRKLLLWDPPATTIGTADPPGSYVPLFDTSLPPEARGPTFGVWVSSYFKHGNLSSHNFDQLNQRDPDPSRQATILKMTPEEIAANTDFAPGPKYDTVLCSPSFAGVHWDQTNKALFDPECREQWGGLDVVHMYGDSNSWIILNGLWSLERG